MVELAIDRLGCDFVPSKYRVCAYFADDTVLKLLERQAARENRSLSNLVATILMKAAEEFERSEQDKPTQH